VIEGENPASRRTGDHGHDEPISQTPGRWVAMRDLRTGDALLSRTGELSQVSAAFTRRSPEAVYNLEVTGLHSYAVANIGTLVHNADDYSDLANKAANQLGKDSSKAAGVVDGIEPAQLKGDADLVRVAYRGDRSPFMPLKPGGIRKAHIDIDGRLVPPGSGTYSRGVRAGQEITPVEHVLGNYRPQAKVDSPFISLSETVEQSVAKYGEGIGIKVDLAGLRQAVANGTLPGTQIIEHAALLESIKNSTRETVPWRQKAYNFAAKDKEILVRGPIPKKFILAVSTP
jgi:hypothetical protein